MIEITTIGAGGGSIASVDRGGLLQVGPEAPARVPGPVCYGQGNTRPTLTDANVVLGRINAARPLGGELTALDVEAAKAPLRAHVGAPLGLDATAAAEAIVRVADARMAGAIRLVSIERGHDPAQLRRDAVRRRRRAARRRADPRDRPEMRARAALSRASPRRSAA